MSSARFVSSIRNHTRRSHTLARAIAESLEPRMLLASTFSDPLSLPAGNGAHAIAAADFNADGRADLAITNSLDNTVTLFLARADRQFQPAQTFPVAAAPANVVAGDFNGDGRLDLAIPCANNTITTLLGQPDGTFLRQDLQGTWNPGIHIFARDLNLDGYDDLITGGFESRGGYSYNASILRYGGANGLTASTQQIAETEAIADMNNDGRADLLGGMGAGAWYEVQLFLGSPDGNYQDARVFGGLNWRYELLAGDFNGDGHVDVLTPTDDCLNLFYGNGDGTLQQPIRLGTGETMSSPTGAAADFDRDGKDDVIYGAHFPNFGPQLLYGKDMIATENPWEQFVPTEPLDALYTLAADFNGDGFPDLARPSSEGAAILFNNRVASPTAILTLTDDSGTATDRSVTLPDTQIDHTSTPKTFTLRNDGTAPLQVSTLSLAGGDAADFLLTIYDVSGAITTSPTITLPPTSSCRLELRLHPTTPGPKSATLTFTTNDASNSSVTLSMNGTALAGEVIAIPDANLEAALRQALNKPTGAITAEDMQSLTEFYAPSKGIADLTGLEYATNLAFLSLLDNQIRDLSPLAGLTNLTSLLLEQNPISDITPLATLTKLTTLDLSAFRISDLSPVTGLVNLTNLTVTGLRDIRPLATLTNLTHLSLVSVSIDDVSPLATLTKLTDLNLEVMDELDIHSLSSLTNLSNLRLSSTYIGSLSPLGALTNLTNLDLGGNQLSDLQPLTGLTNLTNLGLSDNRISDLSPLSGLTRLNALYLDKNQIRDLIPLSSLTNLTWLDLRYNNLSLREGSANMEVIRSLQATIAMLHQHEVAISYIPQTTGPTDDLRISDDSGNPTDYILTLPDTQVDQSSDPKTFTLRNDGTAPLQISSVSLAGGDAADFQLTIYNASGTLTTNPNVTLPPASSCRLEVRLRPTTPGPKSATLFFITNDPIIPYFNLTLTGQATIPSPTILPGTPGDDTYYLRTNGTNLEVFLNQPATSTPSYVLPLSSLATLMIDAAAGNNHLTIGSPLPFLPRFLSGTGHNTLEIEAGQYQLATDLSQDSPDLSLLLSSSAALELAAPQHLTALTLEDSSRLTLTAKAKTLLQTQGLSLAPTATLDLADNALILSATPQTKHQALASLSAAIKSARGSDGKWLGSGVGSSAANANKQTGLSIMLNDKSGKPIMTTFAGQSVNENDILVKYTWNGDVNLDGKVDAADYFLVDSGFITQQGGQYHGDLNYDGIVDAGDYFLIDSAFIAQTAPLATKLTSPLQQLFSLKPLL